MKRLGLMLTIGLLFAGHALAIDLDHDGMSDVWQRAYNVPSADANKDYNGSGLTNVWKSLLGLDPFTANAVFKLQQIPDFPNHELTLRLSTVYGKNYQMETSSQLTGWTSVSSVFTGTGGLVDVMVTLNPAAAAAMFRSRYVSDSQLAGDLFTTWERHQLGLSETSISTVNDGYTDYFKWEIGVDPATFSSLGDNNNDGIDNLSAILLGYDPSGPPVSYTFPPTGATGSLSLSNPTLTFPTQTRPPIDPADSNDDGWSDQDSTIPVANIEFAASSDGQFEAWRNFLTRTITGRTYFYRLSGRINYQFTSSGHFKDYAYILDQGNAREDAVHWQAPVTFIDLHNGQPDPDHVYFVSQTGNGGIQQIRPQDIKSGDVWSPTQVPSDCNQSIPAGTGGPDGVADSYEDNCGALDVVGFRPRIGVVQFAAYDATWLDPNHTSPGQWQAVSSLPYMSTGDDVEFEVDLGDPALNDAVSSATWQATLKDGPAGTGSATGSAVSGNARRADFVNLKLGGQIKLVATLHLQGGQTVTVDGYFEIGIRTKSVTIIHWINGDLISPSGSFSDAVISALLQLNFINPTQSTRNGLLKLYGTGSELRLPAAEHILKDAPDVLPNGGAAFSTPQAILDFINGTSSKFRLGNTLRLNYSAFKIDGAWTFADSKIQSAPALVAAGHTQVPGVPNPGAVATVVQRDWLAYAVLQPDTGSPNFGAERQNKSSGNERLRVSGAARVGNGGQLVAYALGQPVPWIYSNITFDASSTDGNTIQSPDLSAFPSCTIFIDNTTPTTIDQSSVGAFLATANNPLPSINP